MDYNVKHKIKDVKGVCGVDERYWGNLLQDNNVKIKSLKACIVIYKELLEKHKSKREAIKAYKGVTSKSNLYLIDRVIETEKGLK